MQLQGICSAGGGSSALSLCCATATSSTEAEAESRALQLYDDIVALVNEEAGHGSSTDFIVHMQWWHGWVRHAFNSWCVEQPSNDWQQYAEGCRAKAAERSPLVA